MDGATAPSVARSTGEMSSHVVARSAHWRFAVCLCALAAVALGSGVLHSASARAFLVDASGHRFGVTPRRSSADAALPLPGSAAEQLVLAGPAVSAATSTTPTTTSTTSALTSDSSSSTHTGDTTTETLTSSTTDSAAISTTTATTTATTTNQPTTTTSASTQTSTSTPPDPSSMTATAPALPMQYHGGPVIRDHSTYAIFWDPGDLFPPDFEVGVNQFFTDIANASGSSSNEYSVLAQYSDSTGPGVYQSAVGGSLVDTDPYPSDDGSSSCPASTALPSGYTWCVSDQQIRDELSKLIADNDWPATSNAIYFVFLPQGIDECFTGPDGSTENDGCADSEFCSYHSYFGSGQPPLYAVLPWADVPGCQTGYSPNGSGGDDPLDDQLSLVSHESGETITDPFGTSWYDANGDETADGCTDPDQFGPLSPVDPDQPDPYDQFNEQFPNGPGVDHYILQENFSNDGDSCRARYMARFDAPVAPVVAHSVTFSALPVPASPGSPTIADYAWDFGDGATATGATAAHTYATPGLYTVSLTTTASDGSTDSVSHTVAVSTVIAQFSPPVQITAGQPAVFDASSSLGAVSSYSWDFGDGTPVVTSSSPTASHTYATANTYTVTLTVSGAGDENSSSQPVDVGIVTANNTATNSSTQTTQTSTTGAATSDSTITVTTTTSSTTPPTSSESSGPLPTVTITPPPPVVLHASIARAAAAKVDVKGRLTVAYTGETVGCPKGARTCVVAATLVHVASSGQAAAAARRSVTLSAERLVVDGGHSVAINLDLNANGVALLRSAGHLHVDLEIVASVTGGAAITRVSSIELTAPPKR